MRRPIHAWAVFAACGLGLSATLAWLTDKALELDRAEATARAQAALEENSRLALWRIDSAMAALVARESATPASAYQPFLAPGAIEGEADPGERRIPSPLLLAIPPEVKLHVVSAADGSLRSPQVPTGKARDWAVPQFLKPQEAEVASARLAEIRRCVGHDALASRLPVGPAPTPLQSVALNQVPVNPSQDANPSQSERNSNEFQLRQQLVLQNFAQQAGVYSPSRGDRPRHDPSPQDRVESPLAPMTPLWSDGELLLARRATLGGEPVVQTCWLDWPAIRSELLASVRDLLPSAELLPAESVENGTARLLATLPVRLEPGPTTVATSSAVSPIGLALMVAWTSLAFLLVAIGGLLRGVVALSERRAAFVSAVTHELRTPLTTFRLYAEMLAEGMVPAEADRRKYLDTLRIEADRLMHLVENVLAYARLERGARGARLAPVTVDELLSRIAPRLHDRARLAGATLEIDAGQCGGSTVRTDPAAVEQIVFNLVDNACKYGQPASGRIRLEAERRDGRVLLAVRDFGPGVDPDLSRRLFQPFRKSARDAADSAPGVGLGLALCRRLARELRGNLRLEPTEGPGARFVLELRVS